jgi:predicted ester cyclase
LTVWFETAQLAFPDVHFDVLDMIAEDDKVVTRWRYRATNTGPFLGRPPTGRAVTDEGITTLRFEDGKVVEEWVIQDSLGLLKQLGVLPR